MDFHRRLSMHLAALVVIAAATVAVALVALPGWQICVPVA